MCCGANFIEQLAMFDDDDIGNALVWIPQGSNQGGVDVAKQNTIKDYVSAGVNGFKLVNTLDMAL